MKRQNTIKAIGPPPYDTLDEVKEKDGYIFRYGGVIHENSVKQIGILQLMFLTSPEYSLSEGFKTFMMKGYKFTMDAMWDEVKNVNLAKEIQSIEVPIYFFEGKYDMATPIAPIEDFYDTLVAEKGKKFIIFENSAHFPMIEEKEKYQDLLVNVVLRESQSK